MIRKPSILLLALAAVSTAAFAAECRVASGPRTAVLVELYTSEGCSSCPPADRWLSGFASSPHASGVVPLAFHVDYWDSLGWKDRFGDPRFTARQAAQMQASGARFVYTPQVIVGGRDMPSWNSAEGFASAVERIRARPARATIELAPRAGDDGRIEANVRAAVDASVASRPLELVVALTQNGLSSAVTAGENRGERLAHAFVVRDLWKARLAPGARPQVAFRHPDGAPAAQLALSAFIQDSATGEVIQALSAPLCR